ncbi:hypothetical protein ASE90_04620 [Sphingomonas sp. Leaf67]|nr:hypothetical protein ASE90_04620 [Sphingomonas sp. Leaf67]
MTDEYGSIASLLFSGSLPVTFRRRCDRVALMLTRAWSLLLMLLLSSLVLATTVHASESAGPATVECSGPVHSDADTGPDGSDNDKAALHHHGNCHAGTFSVPQRGALNLFSLVTVNPATLAQVRRTPSRAIDPALRPPAA